MWRKESGGLSDALVHITKPSHLILGLVTLAHKALGDLGGSVFMLSPDFCLLKVEAQAGVPTKAGGTGPDSNSILDVTYEHTK